MSATDARSLLSLLEDTVAGRRLTADEAHELWARADLHALAHAAHRLRLQRAMPEVTYVIDRNINYTNICVCGCQFCAYFCPPNDPKGFLLSFEELGRKIEETLALGGAQILLQGGHHPDLPLSYYEELLGFIRSHYPTVHVHAFSPPEIVFWAEKEGLEPAQVVARLHAAGLASIPGGGAEILVDRVRELVAPNKCSTAAWLDVMRQAHLQGLRTTATMMFGHVETPQERIAHLLALRDLQDETGGFTAFIPWTYQPGERTLQATKQTSPEYLRMVAISRLVLDNFANIQASWVTMGPKIAQLSLYFGANDLGSTMIEENVVRAAGVGFRLSEAELRRLAEDAGFAVRRRFMNYTLAAQ